DRRVPIVSRGPHGSTRGGALVDPPGRLSAADSTCSFWLSDRGRGGAAKSATAGRDQRPPALLLSSAASHGSEHATGVAPRLPRALFRAVRRPALSASLHALAGGPGCRAPSARPGATGARRGPRPGRIHRSPIRL